MARSGRSQKRGQRATDAIERAIGVVVERVLRLLFKKREKPTYFEIQSTYHQSFVLRTLTPEAHAWSEKFLAEPLPGGERLVSSAIVAAIAAEAVERGYLVRFV
jgi:hypothetical protein